MRYVIFLVNEMIFCARQNVFESMPHPGPVAVVDVPKTIEYVRAYQRDINRPIIFINEVMGPDQFDITRPDKYAALELDAA